MARHQYKSSSTTEARWQGCMTKVNLFIGFCMGVAAGNWANTNCFLFLVPCIIILLLPPAPKLTLRIRGYTKKLWTLGGFYTLRRFDRPPRRKSPRVCWMPPMGGILSIFYKVLKACIQSARRLKISYLVVVPYCSKRKSLKRQRK